MQRLMVQVKIFPCVALLRTRSYPIHHHLYATDDTPYYGGTFHIKLVLSQDFPSSPPRGFFMTKIFHPNVASNGDICVNTLKRDWTPAVTLAHIFQVRRFCETKVQVSK